MANTYIKFHYAGEGVRRVVSVISTRDILLGRLEYYPPWSKFVFCPVGGTLYDKGCLLEIIAQLNLMNGAKS